MANRMMAQCNRMDTQQTRFKQSQRAYNNDEDSIPFDGCDTMAGKLLTKLSREKEEKEKHTVKTGATTQYSLADLSGSYKNVKTGEVIKIDDM